MKRWLSAVLCALLLIGSAPDALAADYSVRTFKKGVLGTLNSSGASYEAQLTIPGYIGQLAIDDLVIDGKKTDVSISVVEIQERATVDVTLKSFDGVIYDAQLYPEKLTYKQGEGFERSRDIGSGGQSSQKGGKLDFGSRGGFYGGRIHFYYSMEDLGYANIDAVPDDKWVDLFWFNLGTDYLLALTKADIAEFLETGELDGYTWPGLRKMLAGERDLQIYVNGSFDNFQKVNPYQVGVFPDISTQWYAPYAARTYEVNLMKGLSNGRFYAEGQMTVAEGITIAARLHNIYYGRSGVFEQGSPWYQVYVGYAIERGMITDDTFDDYTRTITRKEMASLLSSAVELTRLERINTGVSIPDMKRTDKTYAAIKALYESGVLTGKDAEGNFWPDANINRAEVATMIARLVSPELRIKLD